MTHLYPETNMNSSNWRLLIFLLIISISPTLVAQEVKDPAPVYKWFDGVVSVVNTGLYNGIEYIEEHRTINEQQKFFKNIYYAPGRVVYDDQPYYNIDMKYNVYDDLLLLRGTGSKPLQLHKSRVQEFSLFGHDFVNITGDTTGVVKGYYEILLETEDFTLLKKHKKKDKKFLDRSFTYFEFHEDTPRYAIAYEGNYYPVNTRREVNRIFPEHSREIRRFYRENRTLSKNNYDLFMTELLKKLIQ